MNLTPIHFYGEPITVHHEQPPLLEKRPDAPDAFTWREETYPIVEVLAEWFDYTRRGRFKRSMQPQHAITAERRGSLGVGVFYFRVRVENGRIFDIYYDRAPKDADHRKGGWFIYQELSSNQ